MSTGTRTDSMSDATGNEIAIVGMSGRFPGAPDIETFWNNLRAGVESVRVLDDAALRAAGVPDASIADPTYVKSAPGLDGVGDWDAEFFGFSPNDAAIMDPQHRLFLECAWEALEEAGHPPEQFDGAVAVFAGCGQQSYYHQHVLTHPRMVESIGHFLLRHTGNDKDFLATRCSYLFDLRGPSLSIQTACSTSLVAVHLAVQSLLSGECDMALAGGVTIEPQGVGYHFREGEILSPDGHCRAFDATSQGTIFGSGAGVVVLRRLADALADGDHVWAVVKGSAVNNDGAGKVGYLAPSVDGQSAAASEAIAIAGIDASTIGLIEAHGTGTPVGDPIEVAALTQAFRGTTDGIGYCALGSVKTNIGHLDTAAGVAGLIKAALAVHHAEIPPTLNFTSPNPLLDLPATPFYVNSTMTAWPRDIGPRRAGINSVAVGGTNAHVVIEQGPAQPPARSARRAELLVLSARNRQALDEAAERLSDHLGAHPELNLSDVAFTLQQGRRAMRERRAIVCRASEDPTEVLGSADAKRVITATASAEPPSVGFCFAGGGAQYVAMGADLYAETPIYRAMVERCMGLLETRGLAPEPLSRALRGTVRANEELQGILERPSVGLPALIITQLAIAELWKSWGIRPSAMIGHSMGEYTAAYLAGVFSLEDVLRLVALRGQLFERVPPGAMVSVPLSADEARALLPPELSLAAENAPGLCVVSGPVDAIDRFERECAARDVETNRLRIAVAAHSAMLEPILSEFEAFFNGVSMRAPTLPFVSNLTGDWITPEQATSAGYWVRHLRQTVRFDDGMRRLIEDPSRILVEVGPGRTLVTLARQQPTFGGRLTITSMRRHDEPASDVEHALDALGRLWAAGVDVAWQELHDVAKGARRVSLPTYPFQRQRHWIAPAAAIPVARAAVEESSRAASLDSWFHVPSWSPAPIAAAVARPAGWAAVIHDDHEHVAQLSAELRARGWRVTEARAGRGMLDTGRDQLVFDPSADAGWERLVAELHSAGRSPDVIVDVRNVRPIGHASAAEEEERAFYQPLRLARALGGVAMANPLRIVFVASGTQRIGDEPVEAPLRALALGASRVMPRELPNVSATFVDVRSPISASKWKRLHRAIADELSAATSEPLVCYRGDDRLVQRFERQTLPAIVQPLREGATWLITGGLGGIGLAAAELLARDSRAKLVLLGRSAMPARAEWESFVVQNGTDVRATIVRRLLEIERLGAQVHVATANLADREGLRRALAEARARFGAITGVIHAAGVLADAPLLAKSDVDAGAVLAPKVAGTMVLDEALGDDEVEHFLICSSVSSVAGLAGQIDYAAANAFLDSFAAQRRERLGARVCAIGWSAWSDVGMSAALIRGPARVADRPVPHAMLVSVTEGVDGVELHDAVASPSTHWLLDEHRLRDGAPLIPGTGYLELARAAFDAEGRGAPVELRDVMFLAPFVVPDGTSRTLRVALRRADGQFVIAGRSSDAEAWTEHAIGTALPYAGQVPPTGDVAALERRLAGGSRLAGAEDHPHLSFGARWKNVRGIVYAEREALLSLELPAPFVDDLRHTLLHPALLDMATAGAQRLVPGYDAARDFYVPVSYGRLVMHGPMTARVTSHVRWRPNELDTSELASFDVTVFDDAGNVLVEVEEFQLRHMAPEARLAPGDARRARTGTTTLPLDAPAGAGAIPDAISPAEGVEILRRLLSADLGSHVLIARRPVPDAIEALRRVGEPAPMDRAPAPKPVNRFPETEARLAAHPAVALAVVLERFDRPGNRHVVAYVVPRDGESPTVSELRRFARKEVPPTSVPGTIILMESFVRTTGGDVDIAALHDPFGLADDYIAPRSETERVIAGIWKDALGIEKVGVRDNFFDIGGHSLLAVRAIVRLHKAVGVKLNQAIMVLQTLEQIAAEVDRQLTGSAPVQSTSAKPLEAPPGLKEQASEISAPSRGLFRSIRNAVGKSK